ncbi:hypothetical protein [Adhaeribacter pallidiroseus]|uniref:Uncharacterized protein n=1 Tax=Adhaeribacter pallidiroseus TaxID=2072847 RepID=A0A369Q9Q6_9BACT|nr:hypothetical protein [Adhaeribacter pallidiroseus]RDC61434.1 hypothetical protein AHMF7616_00013 [Adhaeribacter pallidiroseus]
MDNKSVVTILNIIAASVTIYSTVPVFDYFSNSSGGCDGGLCAYGIIFGAICFVLVLLIFSSHWSFTIKGVKKLQELKMEGMNMFLISFIFSLLILPFGEMFSKPKIIYLLSINLINFMGLIYYFNNMPKSSWFENWFGFKKK